MSRDSLLNKISIVVTAYNPDLADLFENLESYYHQVRLVVLCDNSEFGACPDLEDRLNSRFPNIKYIAMQGNMGIAAAQNAGITESIRQGFDYFIEIDQDSTLAPNYVERILDSYLLLVEHDVSACGVGPIAVQSGTGNVYHGRVRNSGHLLVDKTLSSGFFFTKNSYLKAGGKDESLFIDYVDWEWCWRARATGFSIYVDTSLEIKHMLGSGHFKVGLWSVGLPSPIRHYYQYRNSTQLIFKSHVPLKWKLSRLVVNALKLPFYSFCLSDSKTRRKYIGLAFRDIVFFVNGKLK